MNRPDILRNSCISIVALLLALLVPIGVTRAQEASGNSCREFGPALELSGIAEKDGTLFMIDDKSNHLLTCEMKTGRLQSVDVGGIPNQPAKFEDIAYHRPSDTFYVIGAHFSNRPDYQKTYRFQARKEDGGWVTTKAEEVPIAMDVVQSFEGRDSVEGLAITGDGQSLHLWVGLRSEKSGQVRILRFGLDENGPKLIKAYDIKLPDNMTMTKDKIPLHLSGLCSTSTEKLLLLTASEEETDNSFHGNRVFYLDPQEQDNEVIWAGPEFNVGQKAEGIAVWGENHLGILFDNDIAKTGLPSRLMVTVPLFGLG